MKEIGIGTKQGKPMKMFLGVFCVIRLVNNSVQTPYYLCLTVAGNGEPRARDSTAVGAACGVSSSTSG